MRRPFHFHPGPLTILLAIVLCLMAGLAFGQVRRIAPGAPVATPAPVNVLPSASGLTSGAAPGLSAGTPAASGLTSGSAPALPPGSPLPAGLTTTPPGTTSSTTPADTTATSSGGSTRGVVVPIESTPGMTTAPTTTATPAAPGAGTTAGAVSAGFAGVAIVNNGVPSVSATRMQISGPITALQVAQLFSTADSDGDGLLTRAEALRLPMVTMSFDDMDTNRDGVVSRSEYENSLR